MISSDTACNCYSSSVKGYSKMKGATTKRLHLRIYSHALLMVILLILWQSSVPMCSANDALKPKEDDDSIDFTHEKCMKETLTTNQFQNFHLADDYYKPDGTLEFMVRFKGIADGHIILARSPTADEPRYTISLGSYNNRFSEIRRIQPLKVETKMSTPSIMSDLQFRGFTIRYDPRKGHISVWGEGSEVPLIDLEDTNAEPLKIRYFAFATWHNRVVQVAYNCVPKDVFSLVNPKGSSSVSGCQTETVSGHISSKGNFYAVQPFTGENGVVELVVRFRGPSDGHVIFTESANRSLEGPAYVVIMGSYNNKVSEIRRTVVASPVFKINTPEILSTLQYRGFLIRYNEKRGEIWIYAEGSYMPLLHWTDPDPLKIRYFSFGAFTNVVVDVAFNCKPKDLHSLIFQHKPG